MSTATEELLRELVDMTAAMCDACDRHEVTAMALATFALARGERLAELPVGTATPATRSLARMLVSLDERLLAACDTMRVELDRARARLPRPSDRNDNAARMLSDVA